MLSESLAAYELVRRGHDKPLTGMDDPTEASYPMRWWWNEDSVLCFAPWRGPVTRFNKVTLDGALDDVMLGEESDRG